MKITIKKRFFVVVAVALCGLMAMTSCSNRAAIANAIPDDADYVVTANIADIWTKGDLKNSENISFVKLLRQELKQEEPGLSKVVDKLIADPSSCGLDLKHDIAFFGATQFVGNEFVAVAMVNSASKVEDMLRDLSASSQMDMLITKENSYNLAFSDKMNFFVCWDKKKAYLSYSSERDDARSIANTLMAMDKKRSMASNSNFLDFMKSVGEAGAFFDLKNVRYLAETPQEGMENAAYGFSLSFDKGSINAQLRAFGIDNNEMAKIMNHKLNTDLVGYMPNNTLAGLSIAMDMEAMINQLGKTRDGLALDERIVDNITLRDILSCFAGSFVANISNVTEQEKQVEYYDDWDDDFHTYTSNELIPSFTIAADLVNSSLVERALVSLGVERKGNYYFFKESGLEVYIAINNNTLLVTNENSSLNLFPKGGNNGMSKINGDIRKGNYMYADLNVDNYPRSLTRQVDSRILRLLSGLLVSAELRYRDEFTMDMAINLANEKENSLAFIIHYVDDNLMQISDIANL